MTDITLTSGKVAGKTAESKFLARRYASERRFKSYGAIALAITTAFLLFLLVDIVIKGIPAFTAQSVTLPVNLDATAINASDIKSADFETMVKDAIRNKFPEVTARADRKKLTGSISQAAADDLRAQVIANPALIGTTYNAKLLLSDDADLYLKGIATQDAMPWLDQLKKEGLISSAFNWRFLTSADSREPELAGILGALVGSLFTVSVALGLSLPLGVAAAIYLEEFAPKNKFTDFIEININNLAAVPSIIFGLLGLAVFLNLFGLPRSAPLVGGLVLSLLVLPTVIIATRAALKAVPPSIKEAALGVGATHQQAVFQHVLPLALPGILTGSILSLARALGETAPLLMIGMVAFIADIPGSFTHAATALPVQIYLWSDLPEAAFRSRTAATIIILMLVLLVLNALAIYLRRRFERRW